MLPAPCVRLSRPGHRGAPAHRRLLCHIFHVNLCYSPSDPIEASVSAVDLALGDLIFGKSHYLRGRIMSERGQRDRIVLLRQLVGALNSQFAELQELRARVLRAEQGAVRRSSRDRASGIIVSSRAKSSSVIEVAGVRAICA